MVLDTAIEIDGTFLVEDFTYYPAAKNNDLVLNDSPSYSMEAVPIANFPIFFACIT